MENKLDSFLLNFNITNDISQVAFMILNFNSYVNGNIYIIDYNSNWIRNYFTVTTTSSKEFIDNISTILPKLKYIENIESNFEFIDTTLSSFNKSDLVIINGIEKIIPQIDTTNGSEYAVFATKLDYLYSIYQNRLFGIISMFQSDEKTQTKICTLLEQSNNMSISVSKYVDNSYLELVYTIAMCTFEDFQKIFNNDVNCMESFLKQVICAYPQNQYLLEKYALLLFSVKRYSESANIYREIYSITGNIEIEIMARICELFDSNGIQRVKMVDYVINGANGDINLENETIYKLSLLIDKLLGSDYLSFFCLNKANFNLYTSKVYDIVLQKLNILQDIQRVSKALGKKKPYKKEKDAITIAKTRSKFIIPSIQILASYKKGYLRWRDYLEVQDQDFLGESAYLCLLSNVLKIESLYLSINSTYIECEKCKSIENKELLVDKDQDFVKCLKLLYSIKQESNSDLFDSFKNFENFKSSILTPIVYSKDNRNQIICWYYLSVIASLKGLHQDANDCALTILELFTEHDMPDRYLALSLGLLAWGYSEYRVGRSIEGIMCIIASIDYFEITKEVLPFFEEGINIISLFISEHFFRKSREDIKSWQHLSNKLYKINPNLKRMLSKIQGTYSESTIDTMINRINSNSYGWEEDLVTLINHYCENQKYNKALELINKYGKDAYTLLEGRMDIRYRILYTWANVFFVEYMSSQNTELLYYALNYIVLSANDIESKRKNVAHKEERGTIGKESKPIYKLYVDICCLLIKAGAGIKIEIYLTRSIFNVINRLLPQSVIEQKALYSTPTNTERARMLNEKKDIANEEYMDLIKQKADMDIISQKAKEIQEYTEELKHIHPHYRSLPVLGDFNIQDLKKHLNENELLYINILTKIGILEIIISDVSIDYDYRIVDINTIKEKLCNYSLYVQEKKKMAPDEIRLLTKEISYLLSKRLGEYLLNNRTKTLYYATNLDGCVFSISDLIINDDYLISEVESIIKLIDVSVITRKDVLSKGATGVLSRCLGNNDDINIAYIQKQLNALEYNDHFISDNESDNITNTSEQIMSNSSINTVFLYGHGMSMPQGNGLLGSFGIEGKNTVIYLSDILTKIKTDFIVLISCSSGTPNTRSFDEARGTLTDMLERHNGSFIICKWDVDTHKTIEILKRIYELVLVSKETLSRALNIAQREMIVSYPNNPEWWAGLEMWIN